MREFIYHGNAKKLSRAVNEYLPFVGFSLFQKLLRKKDIRINGIRTGADLDVADGDKICVYYDESRAFTPEIIYEDDNIAVLFKRQGIPSEGEQSLESAVRGALGGGFRLCHRLDTNTSGLVIFAKNDDAEREIAEAFLRRRIEKYYLAYVDGEFKAAGERIAYLKKNADSAAVRVSGEPRSGAVKIVTRLTPMTYADGGSIVEVCLVTGKTHQIRAHLAYLGFPIVGDPKYGSEDINKRYGKRKQQLTAYRLKFLISTGGLSYLNGKEIALPTELLPEFFRAALGC